ncbi:MAG: M16 family metallopeptidase [Gammaproteobacteria bacterium]
MLTRVLWLLIGFAPGVIAGPVIQDWQTDRGSRILFVESRELPIVDIKIMFDAGSSRDPKRKAGLAQFTSSLLDEGAGGLDADGISYEFERLGAHYGAGAGYDSSTITLRSLAGEDKLQAALKNLRRVIAQPDFPAQAITRQRKRFLVGLQDKQQSPGSVAHDNFFAALYQKHPYARPPEGTEAGINAIKRADIKSFHRRYYTARNALITIVGDLSRAEAEVIAEDLTRDLPRGKPPAPLPRVKPLRAAEEIRVQHASTQVHILLGQPALARGDKDNLPLYVGNHVLGGGGMISRLFEEIRDQRGLTYSVYSYFSPRRKKGPFMAGLQTRAEQQGQALQVLREMIADYINTGPTEAELQAAKLNITGGFPLNLDSNGKILNQVALIGFYNLPLDYLDTYIDKVNAVTVSDIKQAFAKHLHPDKFVAVLVGPVDAGAGEARAE